MQIIHILRTIVAGIYHLHYINRWYKQEAQAALTQEAWQGSLVSGPSEGNISAWPLRCTSTTHNPTMISQFFYRKQAIKQ